MKTKCPFCSKMMERLCICGAYTVNKENRHLKLSEREDLKEERERLSS